LAFAEIASRALSRPSPSVISPLTYDLRDACGRAVSLPAVDADCPGTTTATVLRASETAVSVLKEQVLQKHGKALVIYGAAHFYRTMPEGYLSSLGEDIGIARTLEIDFPGRTFVGDSIGPTRSSARRHRGH